MAKDVDLLSYWMPVLRNLKEFKAISQAEEPEFKLMLEAIDRSLNNMFIETADELGIKRYERMMSIFPEEGEDLDVRRFNIQVKWNDKLPYTEETLKSQLALLCGEDGYKLMIDNANYTLVVKLALDKEDKVATVTKLLHDVVPANIVTSITLYTSYSFLTAYTHEYLANFTHKTIREDVI